MPMNHAGAGNDALALRDRQRAGSRKQAGDIEPMTIDTSVTFGQLGGLDHHVRSLKEMIVFPLLVRYLCHFPIAFLAHLYLFNLSF